LTKARNKDVSRSKGRPQDVSRAIKHATRLVEAWRYMQVIEENENPSQRLAEFLKRCADNAVSLLNSDNPSAHESDASLTLMPDHTLDQPILHAFRKANLDPNDPFSWRVLMTFFCWSHFPPERSAGPPTIWTSDRCCELLREIHKLKPKIIRGPWESRACDKLSDDRIFMDKGRPLTSEALRRALPQARDPRFNGTLKRLVYEGLLSLMEDYRRKGHVWPPVDVEAALAGFRGPDRRTGRRGHSTGPVERKAPPKVELKRRRDSVDVAEGQISSDEVVDEERGAEVQHFLKVLKDQRAKYHDAFLKAVMESPDNYDALLKALEDELEKDQDALRLATMRDGARNIDAYLKALDDLRELDNKSLLAGFAEYYCEKIATGEVV
jgi:hypothetical protein